jgi:hypothetical protein
MSERLLDSLQRAFEAHGLRSHIDGGRVSVQDGLTVEPRVHERGEQVQVDFAVESPRLAGVGLLDSFAGVGADRDAAELNAFDKFLAGSFHVLVEALTDHRRGDAQVDWDDWSGVNGSWRVCMGPLFLLATRNGARLGGFDEFFPAVEREFCAKATAGPHWVRIFLGSLDGKHLGGEVLVDGAAWPETQAALDNHSWVMPEGYASLRLLLIALPTPA